MSGFDLVTSSNDAEFNWSGSHRRIFKIQGSFVPQEAILDLFGKELPARTVTVNESCLVIFFWIHFFQFFIRFSKQRRHYEMTFTRFKHPGLSRFKGVTPDFRPNFENPQLFNRWR